MLKESLTNTRKQKEAHRYSDEQKQMLNWCSGMTHQAHIGTGKSSFISIFIRISNSENFYRSHHIVELRCNMKTVKSATQYQYKTLTSRSNLKTETKWFSQQGLNNGDSSLYSFLKTIKNCLCYLSYQKQPNNVTIFNMLWAD